MNRKSFRTWTAAMYAAPAILIAAAPGFGHAPELVERPSVARTASKDTEAMAEITRYERLFADVSNKVHHAELNERINRFHRDYAKLRRDLGRPPARVIEGDREAAEKRQQAVLDAAERAYETLRSVMPVVDVRIAGGRAEIAESNNVGIVSGRPDYLLVNLSADPNAGAASAVVLEAGSGDGIEVDVAPLGAVRGSALRYLVEARVAKAGDTTLPLRLRSKAGGQPFALPVSVKPSGRLIGRLIDDAIGESAPARIIVEDENGRQYLPQGYDTDRPSHYEYAYGHFYADGAFEVVAPAGETTVRLRRGFEFDELDRTVKIPAGGKASSEFRMTRWIDMVSRGWYSLDSHLHYVRFHWYDEGDYDALDVRKRAEDINVGNVLPLMHWWKPQDLVAVRSNRYAPRRGLLEKYSDGRYVTTVGEEFRNNDLYGHLVFWDIDGLVEPVSTGWMGGPDAPDWPSNTMMAERAHDRGGLVSAAHDIGREVPVMAALGQLDLVDLHRPDKWYDLLNCGFRLPCEIGSDYPANRMGFARAYVHTGSERFVWRDFIDALAKGRTFISSGSTIFFEADGKTPGDTIAIKKAGPQRIRVKLRAQWRLPLQRLEIVHNGKVLKQIKPATPGTTIAFDDTIEVPGKGWIAARCSPNQHNHWWPIKGVAHTSPIYLDDGTGPYVSTDSARRMLEMCDSTLRRAEAHMKTDTPKQREEVVATFEKAIAYYKALIQKAE